MTISIYFVSLSSLFSLFPHSCVLLFNKCFRSDCGGSPAMEPQVLQSLVTSQNLPCHCQLHGLSGTTWVFPTSPLLNRVEHQKTDDSGTHTKTSSIVMMNKLSRSIILLAWSSRQQSMHSECELSRDQAVMENVHSNCANLQCLWKGFRPLDLIHILLRYSLNLN